MSVNFPNFNIQPGEVNRVEVFTDDDDCWLSFEAEDIVKFINCIFDIEITIDDLIDFIRSKTDD